MSKEAYLRFQFMIYYEYVIKICNFATACGCAIHTKYLHVTVEKANRMILRDMVVEDRKAQHQR